MELDVTQKSFKKEVLESDEPVLVDFWAAWCMPCRMIAPTIAEIAKDYTGRLKVVKVNVDDSPGLAHEYGISGIPTLAIFKGGELVQRVSGAYPKAALVQVIKPYLAA